MRHARGAGVLLTLVCALAGCSCVTEQEHRSFVEASRAFYDQVAPVYSRSVSGDPGLSAQSKRNRLGVLEDYRRAVETAEEKFKP